MSGLDAAYNNYGMDMESWRSDKYSQARYKVGPKEIIFIDRRAILGTTNWLIH